MGIDMTSVAVVAQSGKTFGGAIRELRQVLDDAGFPQRLWWEVAKSKQAPACALETVESGADAQVDPVLDVQVGEDLHGLGPEGLHRGEGVALWDRSRRAWIPVSRARSMRQARCREPSRGSHSRVRDRRRSASLTATDRGNRSPGLRRGPIIKR